MFAYPHCSIDHANQQYIYSTHGQPNTIPAPRGGLIFAQLQYVAEFCMNKYTAEDFI